MKHFFRRLLKWLFWAFLAALLFTGAQTATLRYVNPPCSAFMIKERLFGQSKPSLRLAWASLPGVSPHLARAVIAAEDQRFYTHRGFDWTEIRRAVETSRQGGRLRGASTITMQTARNMFLWPERSWARKGLEAWYTLLLELFLPKNRILEIYLNVAQFGPGLYGAPAAAKTFFQRPAAGLTRSQAAALALMLPAPSKRSPHKLTKSLAQRKRFILRQMRNVRLVDWPD